MAGNISTTVLVVQAVFVINMAMNGLAGIVPIPSQIVTVFLSPASE